jgi:putative transposase
MNGLTDRSASSWLKLENISSLENLNLILVRLVAEQQGLDIDLGIKEETGILKSMQTQATFLSDQTHRIIFYYTPGVTWRVGSIAT